MKKAAFAELKGLGHVYFLPLKRQLPNNCNLNENTKEKPGNK